MKIMYLGPSISVPVGGFGPHRRGEVKDYPEDVGRELLATMRRQKFKLVEEPKGKARKAGSATAEESVPAEGGTARLDGEAWPAEPAREAPGGTVADPEPGGGPAAEPAGEVPTAAGVGGQAPRKVKGKGRG